MSTEKLLRYKKQITQFKDEANKQTGVLDEVFSDLRNEFNYKDTVKEEAVVKRTQKKIEELKVTREKEQELLDDLLEQIEDAVAEWD